MLLLVWRIEAWPCGAHHMRVLLMKHMVWRETRDMNGWRAWREIMTAYKDTRTAPIKDDDAARSLDAAVDAASR